MSMAPINDVRVDRTALVVQTFEEAEKADLAYWRSRTVDERLEALELCRQIAYGYDPTVRQIAKVIEVCDLQGNLLWRSKA